MKTYQVTGLRDYWNFATLTIKAANEAAAKKKFRKRITGRATGLSVREVQAPTATRAAVEALAS